MIPTMPHDLLANLFTHPMQLSSNMLLWLLLPLCAAVAIIYKTIRNDNLRRLPLEMAALMGYIVAGLVALGVALWLVLEYWP